MDTITVKLDELVKLVNQIKADNAEYVTIQILEPEDDFDIPATLELSAVGKHGDGITVNYDGIEAVEAD